MSWILKAFSFRTLLEFAARLRLGGALWDLIVRAVDDTESFNSDLPGEQKFQLALSHIRSHAAAYALSVTDSLVRWGIETAVRLMKDKLAGQ